MLEQNIWDLNKFNNSKSLDQTMSDVAWEKERTLKSNFDFDLLFQECNVFWKWRACYMHNHKDRI